MKTFFLRKIGVLSLLFFMIFLTFVNSSATNPENHHWRPYTFDKEVWELGEIGRLILKNNTVFATCSFKDRIRDTMKFNYIAELQDTMWVPLGSGDNVGVRGPESFTFINDVLIKDSLLFVCGIFDTVGSIPARNIGIWNINSRSWSSVGKGTNGIVTSLTMKDTNLFVGGYFDSVATSTDTIICRNIAKWNGTRWDTLGQGLNGSVSQMIRDGNNIYAVGYFDTVGTTKVKHIGIWNDSSRTWSSFGNNGPIGEVRTICKVGNCFYFGGIFDSVYTGNSTIYSKNITRWDGSSWDSVGSGINGHISQMVGKDTNLFVVGLFTMSINDSDSCQNIAMWDGTNWNTFGTGTNKHINSIALKNDSVLVGGAFQFTGDLPATRIGLWDFADTNSPKQSLTLSNRDISNHLVLDIYPNPTNKETNIEFFNDENGLVDISLFDITGKKIKNIISKDFNPGWHSVTCTIENITVGNYICIMAIGSKSISKKLLLFR